jgi:heme O synthase-like polyprenyltransferase
MTLPIITSVDIDSNAKFYWHKILLIISPTILFFIAHNVLFQQTSKKKNHALTMKYQRAYEKILSNREATLYFLTCVFCATIMLVVTKQYLFLTLLSAALIIDSFVFRKLAEIDSAYKIIMPSIGIALLPIIGASCITNHIDTYILLQSFIFFIAMSIVQIIFMMHKRQSYMMLKIPAIPNTYGLKFCKTILLFLTTLLIIATFAIFILKKAHLIYLAGILMLNAKLFSNMYNLYNEPGHLTAKKCYKYCIVYMGLFMLLLCVDHYFSI